jgi:hypothetical protein
MLNAAELQALTQEIGDRLLDQLKTESIPKIGIDEVRSAIVFAINAKSGGPAAQQRVLDWLETAHALEERVIRYIIQRAG